jgi:hypothetical protein
VIQKKSSIWIILIQSHYTLTRYTHVIFGDHWVNHSHDMTSILSPSLNISWIWKVSHLPDQNPDLGDFKIFGVKGHILSFQVAKSTKNLETTGTLVKYILLPSKSMLNSKHPCDPEEVINLDHTNTIIQHTHKVHPRDIWWPLNKPLSWYDIDPLPIT